MAPQTSPSRKPLADLLLEQGLLSRVELDGVLGKMNGRRISLAQAVMDEGLLPEEKVAMILAQQCGLVYDPLTDFRVNQQFYQTIPVELMHRHPFVPLKESDGVLTLAIADPHDLPGLDELELLLGRSFMLVLSTRSAILKAVARSEGTNQALKELEAEYRSVLVKEDDRGEEVLSVETITKDQSPVVKLIDTILLSALQKRASDIHIEASDHAVQVRLRLDGILTPAMEPLDAKLHAPLISRLKVMSELDIAERRVPQDGRFRIRLDHRTVDFRVSILPSAYGESVVIRILDREAITAGVSALRLDRLGFNREDLRKFRRSITEPYGMVLGRAPPAAARPRRYMPRSARSILPTIRLSRSKTPWNISSRASCRFR